MLLHLEILLRWHLCTEILWCKTNRENGNEKIIFEYHKFGYSNSHCGTEIIKLKLQTWICIIFHSLYSCLGTYVVDQTPFEQLVGSQLVKEILFLYGIWMIVTVFTRGCHWSLDCFKSHMSSVYTFTFIRIHLILSCYSEM